MKKLSNAELTDIVGGSEFLFQTPGHTMEIPDPALGGVATVGAKNPRVGDPDMPVMVIPA